MFRKPVKRPGRRLRPVGIDRAAYAAEAVDLFNRGQYWEAHEALEMIWRSVPDQDEARVLQGLIQAAAAMLHRERGNRHGITVVGGAALEKLSGGQHQAVEFDTVSLRAELESALTREGPAPRLKLRLT